MIQNSDIFKITHNDILPAKGNILISEPFLQDAYFQRSVVLLVEHDTNGSMGFVLNKKLDLTVNSFFPELKNSPAIPIYLGGPISADKLFFIHALGDLVIPETQPIGDNLYFDGNFNALKQYIRQGYAIEGKVKFFLGYSGWDKNQLIDEIHSNSWVVSRSAQTDLFAAQDENFWKSSITELGGKYKNWINYPKDPYFN